MKRHLLCILTLFSFRLASQDTIAYSLFNSAYSDQKYTLIDKAVSYKLDINRDSLFIKWCSPKVPEPLLNSMLDKESLSFTWDQKKLKNTVVVSDTIAEKLNKPYLSLSAPIFDNSKHFAILLESYDAGNCVHVGPVLFQYKDMKWTMIEGAINSYHAVRGQTVPKEK